MAESNQRKVADPFDISDEDPFAELTRIMGFDPRVPVNSQSSVSSQPKDSPVKAANEDPAPAARAAPVGAPAKFTPAAVVAPFVPKAVEPAPVAAAPEAIPEPHDDFGIDLEKELLGEFADFEAPREVAFEMPREAAPAAVELPAGPEAPVEAIEHPGEHSGSVEQTVEAALADELDGEFEEAFASTLDEHQDAAVVEPAAAFEMPEPEIVPETAAAAPADDDFMADFDFGDIDLSEPSPEAAPVGEAAVAAEPSFAPRAETVAPRNASADDAMTDFDFGDLDLSEPSLEPAFSEEPAVPAEPSFAPQAEAVAPRSASADDAMAEVDMDFSAAFDQEFSLEDLDNSTAAEEFLSTNRAAEEVQPAQPAAAKSAGPVELSLEEELDALLNAASEPPQAAEPIAAPVRPMQAASQPAPVKTEPAKTEPAPKQFLSDSRWAALEFDDEPEQLAAAQPRGVAPLASVPSSEYRRPLSDPSLVARHANFKAAEMLAPQAPPAQEQAQQPTDDLDDLLNAMEHEVHAADHADEPARAEPEAQAEAAPSAPPENVAAEYAYDDDRAGFYETDDKFAGYQGGAPATVTYDDAPEIETVEVPEATVAIADDLDIPELTFEEDRQRAASYDDIDADFSAAFQDNKPNEEPVNQTVRGMARPAEPADFDADFEALMRPYAANRQPGAAEFEAADFQAADDASAYGAPQDYGTAQDDGAPEGYERFGAAQQPAGIGRDRFVDLDFDTDLTEEPAQGLAPRTSTVAAPPRRRGLMIAAAVAGVAVLGGIGAWAFSFGGGGEETGTPVVVKADDSPIKIKPENPGGTIVPNQDNKVYDAVKGTSAATDVPVQEKLVTTSEEPVDMAAVAESDPLPGVNTEEDVIPKAEDRVDPVADADQSAPATEGIVVAPRKVKTMVVRADGSLVPREDAAPATDTATTAEAPALPASNDDETGAVAAQDLPAAKAPAPEAAPAEPATTGTNVAETDGTPEVSALPPAKPVEKQTAPKTETVAKAEIEPPAVATGAWSVQIASQPSAESAKSTYEDLARRYAGVIGGKGVNIVKAEIAGKGTYWRVRVPAQTRDEAVKLCSDYKAAGGNCFISK